MGTVPPDVDDDAAAARGIGRRRSRRAGRAVPRVLVAGPRLRRKGSEGEAETKAGEGEGEVDDMVRGIAEGRKVRE